MSNVRAGALALAGVVWFAVGAGYAQEAPPVPTRRQLTPEEQKAEQLFDAAERFFQKQHWEFAAEKYREFVETNPEHANVSWALFRLGECLYEQNKHAEAAPYYRRVIAEHPGGRSQAPLDEEVGPPGLGHGGGQLGLGEQAGNDHHRGQQIGQYDGRTGPGEGQTGQDEQS